MTIKRFLLGFYNVREQPTIAQTLVRPEKRQMQKGRNREGRDQIMEEGGSNESWKTIMVL